MLSNRWILWLRDLGMFGTPGATPKKSVNRTNKLRLDNILCLAYLLSHASLNAALAGDALNGIVVKVKSGEVVTLRSSTRDHEIRIKAVEVPAEVTAKATAFASDLVLNKEVSVHLSSRTKNGELLSRLFIRYPDTGNVIDVGVELVRAGLAVRKKGQDYKYGELSAAERDARLGGRGYWALSKTN